VGVRADEVVVVDVVGVEVDDWVVNVVGMLVVDNNDDVIDETLDKSEDRAGVVDEDVELALDVVLLEVLEGTEEVVLDEVLEESVDVELPTTTKVVEEAEDVEELKEVVDDDTTCPDTVFRKLLPRSRPCNSGNAVHVISAGLMANANRGISSPRR